MNSQNEPTFKDPYENLSKPDLINTTIEVSREDQAFLLGMFPHRSVLQTTINNLLHRFIKACKQNGLKGYCPNEFRAAVANTVITIGDRSTVAVDGSGAESNKPSQTAHRDDGRRTGEVGDFDQGLPVAASDATSGVPSGGKTARAKKTKGT